MANKPTTTIKPRFNGAAVQFISAEERALVEFIKTLHTTEFAHGSDRREALVDHALDLGISERRAEAIYDRVWHGEQGDHGEPGPARRPLVARNEVRAAEGSLNAVAPRLAPAPARKPLVRKHDPAKQLDADPEPPGTLAALMQKSFLPSDDLLRGIFPARGGGILGAPKAAGKTVFASAIAFDITKGTGEAHGRKLGTGVALYITMEHDEQEYQENVCIPLLGEVSTGGWKKNFYLIATDSEHRKVPTAADERFAWLREQITELGAVYCCIDTWQEFRPARKGNDLYSDDKYWAEQIRKIGRETGCFILLLHHTGKAAKGRDPSADLIATTGLPAGLNVVLGLVRSPGNTNATLVCQGNAIPFTRIPLTFDEKSLRFSLRDVKVGRPDKKLQGAKAWLQEQLSAGPVPSDEIIAACLEADICSERTLKEAKATLKIVSRRPPGQGNTSLWVLPK